MHMCEDLIQQSQSFLDKREETRLNAELVY